ncbi:MAG: mevalonate kinase [Halodesulfurarchaeum sp.]
MATASAPGKVYLFGEHAVVYGEPAVPVAIKRRARVTVSPREDGRLRVQAEDLSIEGFTVEFDGTTSGTPAVDVSQELLEAAMGYVEEAIEQARDAADAPEAGVDVTIESSIPLGAGLGSSAAVVVATIEAASRALGARLDREEIADRAYRVEHAVQDGQASRADTFCSTMGGAVRVEGADCRELPAPELPLVVGYDGGAGDTTALVRGVRSLQDTYDFAANTVAAIGDLVEEGIDALEAADIEELGRLMDVNHGLLAALGVSARSLDAMVWAAREAGANGAKLTGAGGGGCIVALDDTDRTETALALSPDCAEAFRAELDTDGLRRES